MRFRLNSSVKRENGSNKNKKWLMNSGFFGRTRWTHNKQIFFWAKSNNWETKIDGSRKSLAVKVVLLKEVDQATRCFWKGLRLTREKSNIMKINLTRATRARTCKSTTSFSTSTINYWLNLNSTRKIIMRTEERIRKKTESRLSIWHGRKNRNTTILLPELMIWTLPMLTPRF